MKMMKYKLEMMKPYLPVIKAMIEEMTGMDCEELIAMIEEKVFDGHKVAEVMWAIKNGHITKEDMQMWAMEKWEECEFAQMSEEEKMVIYNLFDKFIFIIPIFFKFLLTYF